VDESFDCEKLDGVSAGIFFERTVSEVKRVIKAEGSEWNYFKVKFNEMFLKEQLWRISPYQLPTYDFSRIPAMNRMHPVDKLVRIFD